MYTTTNSDLMWRLHKVHYKGEKYVKVRIMFFYKNSKDICWILNPQGRPRNCKIIRSKYDSWEPVMVP